MSGRILAVQAFWIGLSLAMLAWVVTSALPLARESTAPDRDACSPYRGQSSEGYELSGSTLFLRLPGGGTVTFLNFSNGGGGIMLTTRPVDPFRVLAEARC